MKAGDVMADVVYEYEDWDLLTGTSAAYFSVPVDVIMNDIEEAKVITAFSYLSICRGIDMRVKCSVADIVEWSGRKPNRASGGINDKISLSMSYLRDEGYVDVDDMSGRFVAEFAFDKVKETCSGYRFAILYVDEVEKVLSYSDGNASDKRFSNDILLLVFSYLRMMIYRRKNAVAIEDDAAKRKLRNPEAYVGFYKDIAEDIGVSERLVSKSVDILFDMGLIYYETLPKYKNADGEWRTGRTLFCNSYKREGKMLLASGKSYYVPEASNMKSKITLSKKKRK